MNTLLTAPDIEYLLTQQAKLDSDIRRKHNISKAEWQDMTSEHSLAINVEIHEFINECHDLWKYWKKKSVDKARILDEGVDVIHFIMLHANKRGASAERLHQYLCVLDVTFEDLPVDSEAIEQMILKDDFGYQLYILLKVLEHYGFTAKDILEAYNRKNKVNFERLESGY